MDCGNFKRKGANQGWYTADEAGGGVEGEAWRQASRGVAGRGGCRGDLQAVCEACLAVGGARAGDDWRCWQDDERYGFGGGAGRV